MKARTKPNLHKILETIKEQSFCLDNEAHKIGFYREDVIQKEILKLIISSIDDIQSVVDEQAKDEGLWFVATTASEAYLQQELRRLHRTIEEL